ncbi:glycerate kinase type-2 family protein [Longibacter sp.]|uniref:glycerate kinase type-2 family protein n=1 Tax=Longibacter sp. TaxID=2045415 RepID=UPI003EB92D3A
MTHADENASSEYASSFLRDVRAMFDAAVREVKAARIFPSINPADAAPRPLGSYDGVRVVAFGKAALPMSGAAERLCRENGLSVRGGVAVVPPGYPDTVPADEHEPEAVDVLVGNHPVAGQDSDRAGRRVLAEANRATDRELLLILISGGGTALISTPVEGVDVWDLRATYRLLVRSGAPIHDINVVRKHLTRLGGGQLAAASAADIAGLVVSDVPGNDLSVIASGPTVRDPSTFADALRVAYRSNIWHDLPPTVRDHLTAGARGRRAETPKSADDLGRVRTQIVASSADAVAAARREAVSRGYRVVAEDHLDGEACEAGRRCVREMMHHQVDAPSAWLWGGETTVTVTGDGAGGRNQELALAAAIEMEETAGGTGEDDIILLSAGTDGIDGPTDVAGAWATRQTAATMRTYDVDPTAALDANDSYRAHRASETCLQTGPTHTNVMDVVIGLRS